jgi:hypothetical protein
LVRSSMSLYRKRETCLDDNEGILVEHCGIRGTENIAHQIPESVLCVSNDTNNANARKLYLLETAFREMLSIVHCLRE